MKGRAVPSTHSEEAESLNGKLQAPAGVYAGAGGHKQSANRVNGAQQAPATVLLPGCPLCPMRLVT